MGQICHEDNTADASGPFAHMETSEALGGLRAVSYHTFVGIFYSVFYVLETF